MTGADVLRLMNMLDNSDLVTKETDGNKVTYNYDFIGEGVGVTFINKEEP